MNGRTIIAHLQGILADGIDLSDEEMEIWKQLIHRFDRVTRKCRPKKDELLAITAEVTAFLWRVHTSKGPSRKR